MSTSLLEPPPSIGEGRDPGIGAPDRPPRRPDRRLAALLAATALLGGTAGAGVVAVVDRTAATTVLEQAATGTAATTSSATGLDVAALYADAAPGVVDITAESTAATDAVPFGAPQGSQATATGTGFVIDEQGRFLTAAHVVDDATSITVTFQDGTTRSATLPGQDDATDVAVLQLDDTDGLTLYPLELGSSASLGVGDAVAAIGDPFGYERSISTGIVSGLDRTIEAPNGFTVAHAVQTDAALNPGNSGGPLLAADGTVVGIVDQIATSGSAEQSSGVGFAVPIDLVSGEFEKLIAGEDVSHAYIGLATSDATGAKTGALVGRVASGGPAAAAGIEVGDVITAVGDAEITGSSDLVAAVADRSPGDSVTVTLHRGSSTVRVTVELGTQPASGS